MQDFSKALISERKNSSLPEEFDYFGKLVGSWQINYVDNIDSHMIKGEWHFSWVPEGMAIQDVIILPNYNMAFHFVSIIAIHVHGMLLMVTQEK